MTISEMKTLKVDINVLKLMLDLTSAALQSKNPVATRTGLTTVQNFLEGS